MFYSDADVLMPDDADTSAGRHRAELARQGSLADRQLPANMASQAAAVAARRQNSNPSVAGMAGSGGSGCVRWDTCSVLSRIYVTK